MVKVRWGETTHSIVAGPSGQVLFTVLSQNLSGCARYRGWPRTSMDAKRVVRKSLFVPTSEIILSVCEEFWLLLEPPVMLPYTVTLRLWLVVVALNTALANIGMNCKVALLLITSGLRQFSTLIRAALEGLTIISSSCIRPMSNIILLWTHDPKEGEALGIYGFRNPQ